MRLGRDKISSLGFGLIQQDGMDFFESLMRLLFSFFGWDLGFYLSLKVYYSLIPLSYFGSLTHRMFSFVYTFFLVLRFTINPSYPFPFLTL